MADKVRTQRGPGDRSRGAVETRDLDAKGAAWTIAGLAGLVLFVGAGVAGLFLSFGSMRQAAPSRPVTPSGPHLQTDERADLAAITVRARARLEGKGGGVPIEEAMRQTAAEGWDAGR